MPRPDYAFRPLAAADLALLQRWLAAPYVARWAAPERALALSAADLNEPTMDQFGVTLSAEPFAYLQCCRAAAAEGPAGSEPALPRGIRADRKAGFASERLLETSEGPRLLLTRDSDRNT